MWPSYKHGVYGHSDLFLLSKPACFVGAIYSSRKWWKKKEKRPYLKHTSASFSFITIKMRVFLARCI